MSDTSIERVEEGKRQGQPETSGTVGRPPSLASYNGDGKGGEGGKPTVARAPFRRFTLDSIDSINSYDSESDKASSVAKASIKSGNKPTIQRRILFLCDEWSSSREGIAGINHTLLESLSRFKGVELYCSLLYPDTKISSVDRKDARKAGIILIFPSGIKDKHRPEDVVKILETEPAKLYSHFFKVVRNITHIVGHDPITSAAAIAVKNKFYPAAKVILMFHTISRDVEWLRERGQFPYPLSTPEQAIAMGEQADVVYCVNQSTMYYYSALFRNHASKKVDLRIFWPRFDDEKLFKVKKRERTWKDKANKQINLVVVDDGYGQNAWSGLDIAAAATEKINVAAAKRPDKDKAPKAKLVVVEGVPNADVLTTAEQMCSVLKTDDIPLMTVEYNTPEKFIAVLTKCDLCLVPCRGEPLGVMGILPLCAGIPTLVSDLSATHNTLEKLAGQPDKFIAPVTKDPQYVLQDASRWRDRILSIMENPNDAVDRAQACQAAIKRDDVSKQCYDNFLAFCIGGIRIKFMADLVHPIDEFDPCIELTLRRKINAFLWDVIKNVWRLKHHPLVTLDDIRLEDPAIDPTDIPWDELRRRVLYKIEDYDREIIEVDSKNQDFLVYCPTLDALWDLWSMCDDITARFVETLFPDPNPYFLHFYILDAEFNTYISGPEFLKYKTELATAGDRTILDKYKD